MEAERRASTATLDLEGSNKRLQEHRKALEGKRAELQGKRELQHRSPGKKVEGQVRVCVLRVPLSSLFVLI